jgi:hypothetical protein
MNMRPIIFVAILLVFPYSIHAQVVITEVMYDLEGTDSGREWIEVKNTGTAPVDLSLWKLLEANVNHRISAVGASEISAGGFAVIADNTDKFKADNPNFNGLLFDSAFSLGNEGETLIMRDEGGADIDSISYTPTIGGQGDRNSLQKSQSGWIAANPTPGSENTSEQAPDSPNPSDSTPSGLSQSASSNSSGGSSYSSHSSQSVANMSFDEPELQVTSGRPRLGYVGIPISFETKVKSAKNVPAGNEIQSQWSMGDGSLRSGSSILHTYQFPGEYIVILNSDLAGAQAVSKVKVTIIDPQVSIKSVSSEYIELYNPAGYELNLGAWVMRTKAGRYVVPQDTLIAARSSIKLPASITRLDALKDGIDISLPSGKVVVATAGSSDGSYVSEASIKSGDPLVLIPEGMTIEVMKERISLALREQKPLLPVTAITSEDKPMADDRETVVALEKTQIATSSLPAAVIYTVKNREGEGWWGGLKRLFKK